MAKPPQRKQKGQTYKSKWLIVGEGRETKPNYFRALYTEPTVSDRFALTIKKGSGFDQIIVVKEAIKLIKAAAFRSDYYDAVWCVLDVEGPEKRETLPRATELAKENGINLCLSNPAFEIWFLAHFVKQARSYNDCNAVISELNKHWPQVCSQPYGKSDPRVYERLKSRLSTALANAAWCREVHHADTKREDCNSSTEIYLLIQKLLPDANTASPEG